MARELLIHCPDGQTKYVPLEGNHLTVGRSNAAEICFPDDAGLSRQHLRFERTAAGWVVEDLGSKNGTTVNSTPLRSEVRWRLQPGDRITAGHLLIVVDGRNQAPAGTVVFVEGSGEHEGPSASTVITNLEHALEQEDLIRVDPGRQVSALIRAGRELVQNRPLPELFRTILELAVEAVGATRGVVMLQENGNLAVKAARGEGFQISTAVRDRVLNENISVLVRDTRQDDAFRARLSIVQQKVRTLMAVPLQTGDKVIGLIYVDSPSLLKEFTKDDLALLTVMANVAAIRIEHARLLEVEQAERLMARDLEQAAEIQRRFLPGEAPAIPGADLAGHNLPSLAVGGDYYDFFTYDDGRVGLVLGDVSGKGMPASLMMMALQARVRAMLEQPADLASVMARLNRVTAANCPTNRFITFCTAILTPGSGQVAWCNAGHNPPLVLRADGSIETLEGGGFPLGIVPVAEYEQSAARLQPGDAFVLYSDGVTEAVNSDEEYLGDERLREVLRENRDRPAKAMVDAVMNAVSQWSAGTPQADDITLLVARRT